MGRTSHLLLTLRRNLHDPWTTAQPDAELLHRFVTNRDETAFHILLQRHGPMVLNVCRAVLPNETDVEDAFQVTFLVLAEKARSIRQNGSLASWLHGVAYRTAHTAQTAFARRSKHEPRAARPEARAGEDLTWPEVQRVIHEELAFLSERYRGPLTLCYLQGKTQDEAAEALAMTKGTLKARLERGRTILRARLVRRGLGSTVVLIAAWPAVAEALPAGLAEATLRTVFGTSAPSTILTLKQGVLHTMFFGKWKLAIGVVAMLTVIGLGGLAASWTTQPLRAQEQGQSEAKPPAAAPPHVSRDKVKDRKGEPWERISGPVKVIDARTLEFQDGTRIELDIRAPYLEQMAMEGNRLYPCGKEAADHLRNVIGDKPATCYRYADLNQRRWIGYAGDVALEHAMIAAGWALVWVRPSSGPENNDANADYTAEIAAHEGKRGLWRGKFIPFDDWRAGLRLPGEPPPPRLDEKLVQNPVRVGFLNDEARSVFLSRVIKDLPHAKQLTINANHTDDDLAQVAKLTELEDLVLGHSDRVTEAGFAHLKSLTKLKRLYLTQTTPAMLAHLKAIPNLKQLNMFFGTSDAGLEQLAECPQLEDLWFDMEGSISDNGLRHLAKLPRLRRLIVPAKFSDAGLLHLREHQHLVVLVLRGDFTDRGLSYLQNLSNLEYLDVRGSAVTDAGISTLFRLKKLRVLRLPERITEKARARLRAALPDLPADAFSSRIESFRYETDGLRSW